MLDLGHRRRRSGPILTWRGYLLAASIAGVVLIAWVLLVAALHHR